jgi:capsular polysaccharide biosynthesis protein
MSKSRSFLHSLSHLLGGSRNWKPLISKGLKKLPLSSVLLGPPKSLVFAEDYSVNQSSIFKEIFPEHNFSFPPFPLTHAITGPGFKGMIPGENHFPKSFVTVLPQARVFGGNGVVITDDDRVITESAVEWVCSPEEHSIFKKLKLPSLLHTSERIAVIASKSSPCYFHWMFDILPRIELLRRSGISYDKLYTNPLRLPFQRETIESLGLSPKKMIFSDPKLHLQCSKLVFPSLAAPGGTMPKWVCDFLRSSFLNEPSKKECDGNSRIYITRRNSQSRKIVNEEELQGLLHSHGFKETILENLSVAEQARLFSSAEIILAPHGASLSNLVFCSPATRVIEIFTPNYVNPCYWNLSQHMHLDHHCILGSIENLSEKQREDHDVYVKKEELSPLLSMSTVNQ